jgi:hypothetical protein
LALATYAALRSFSLVYAFAKNKQSQDAKKAANTVVTGVDVPRTGSANGRSEGIIPMHQLNGKEERND